MKINNNKHKKKRFTGTLSEMHGIVGAGVWKMSRSPGNCGGRRGIILTAMFQPEESNVSTAVTVGGHDSWKYLMTYAIALATTHGYEF